MNCSHAKQNGANFASRVAWILPLFVFSGLIGAAFIDNQWCAALFDRLAVPLVIFLMIIWLYLGFILFRPLKAQAFGERKSFFILLGVCLSILFITIVCVPAGFKNLTDEANLASVSASIARNAKPQLVVEGVFEGGRPIPLHVLFPSRPLLFQTVNALFHVLTGYRFQNLIVFNAAVFLGLLLIVAFWSLPVIGTLGAAGLTLLVASYPIFPTYALSAGFDLFSLVFFVIVLLSLKLFIWNRTSESHIFLIYSLLVFANIRYESVFFVFLVPLLLIPITTPGIVARRSWLYAMSPLFLLTFVWQRILVPDRYQTPAGGALFSFSNFIANWKRFSAQLMNLDFYLPYNGIVNFLGLFTVVVLIVVWIRKRSVFSRNQIYFYFIATACAAASLCITLAHHSGFFDDPSQARLFMIPCLFLAVQPLALCVWQPKRIRPHWILIAGAASMLVYFPITARGTFIGSQMIIRMQRISEGFLSAYDPRKQIVVADYPVIFYAMGYSALRFDTLARDRSLVKQLTASGQVENVFFFRLLKTSTAGQVFAGPLPPGFDCRLIAERKVHPQWRLGIGRLSLSGEDNSAYPSGSR